MKTTRYNLRLTFALVLGLGFCASTQAQGMVTINLGINQPPALIADAGPANGFSICEGDTVVLGGSPTASGGVSAYTYSWSPVTDLSSPTDPNPVATPSVTTTYDVQVTDANNCTSTANVTVTVSTPPVAQFSLTANSLDIACMDLSSGTVTAWAWDFGDGGTSTLQNPVHSYGAPGNYIVCLTATNLACSTTTCDTITVLVGLEEADVIPGLQVAPNPYHGSTQIRFHLAETAHVRLEAFDLQGRRLGVVIDGEREAGDQAIEFSAEPFGGAAGTYLLRLTVGEKTATLRLQELH